MSVAPASLSAAVARRTYGRGSGLMFGPSAPSPARRRRPALRCQPEASPVPARSRLGDAWVGRPGREVAGWSLHPITPRRIPLRSRIAGARASSRFRPAPTHGIPAARRYANVSSKAAEPKSSAWLFPSVMQSAPRRIKTSVAAGGARKKNGFRGSGQGRPAQGDAALQIEHEEVRRTRQRSHFLREETLGTVPDDRLGDLAPQHGVSGKGHSETVRLGNDGAL
jgi:hypothetical protein